MKGAVHGFAANEELLKHYIGVFGAEYLGMLHQHQFFIDEEQAKSYWRCIIMNGMKPKFMENLTIAPSYYEQPDPYANAPSCHVNLLELSRYAK